MFVPLRATPRDYAWGSPTAIAELLGSEPSGRPEAELWLGAHPGAPTPIADPSTVGGHADLERWLAADPTALGGRGSLPFLLKVLAAAHPLSLQAHPDLARAAAGFTAENARGVPIDASHRNYKDALHKPELIVALRDGFEALCGFRELDATDALLGELVASAPDPAAAARINLLREMVAAPDGLRDTVRILLEQLPGGLLDALVVAAAAPGSGEFDAERALVGRLAEEYPGDPGVAVALLLNLVTLDAGEALYLPAGNIHAYLRGIGVELMAASDNVLRGGLTPKHVDVPELLEVLEFEPRPVPWLTPTDLGGGLSLFVPDVPDFELLRVDLTDEPTEQESSFRLPGPGIAIVTDGSVRIDGAASSVELGRGRYAFITPDEEELRFSGTGTLFLATTQG
ncbi:mannose-6-phosphate isomerase, class I [Plantibacter sp. VKM Ac-2880]|uniref:mannose-6-phosphate isomerase, class I n=1 Tax=Plantibacter sp. VKM Ac-2880 TaxID=2783827 RepID=UPI00188DE2A8|nr:mannose-6-phosphate isomerase, class I [Plantibacter sp. VKM Ac-2880]MBF4569805.1 mannose-6-phosphate isomerase, class I [Plantibacter sp. VKM Ac-2880]